MTFSITRPICRAGGELSKLVFDLLTTDGSLDFVFELLPRARAFSSEGRSFALRVEFLDARGRLRVALLLDGMIMFIPELFQLALDKLDFLIDP